MTMPDPVHEDAAYDTDAYDDYPSEPEGQGRGSLPPRPRRRIVTPVGIGLAAVAVAALGFIGGVEVQKGQDDSGTGSRVRTGFPGAAAGGGRQGRAGQAPGRAPAGGRGNLPTFGTVSSAKGRTLYVKNSDGTTVKVQLSSQAKITRTAKSGARAIHPGDTVVIQGSKNAQGTVSGASVTATAAGAGSSGGGFPGAGGGFPGAGGAGGGQGTPRFGGGSGSGAPPGLPGG